MLRLPMVTLAGGDFSVEAGLQVLGLETGFEMQGAVTVTADDLSRFAGISGLPLAGSAQLTVGRRGQPAERQL